MSETTLGARPRTTVDFRDPLPTHDLDRLSDEQLIAYIRAMRDGGELPAAAAGLAVLVYGHWTNVRRRVGLKIPAADVEDVSSEVVTSAIASAFDGTSEGEFIVWLGTIVRRRIADYHRSAERRIKSSSLDALTASGGELQTDGDLDRDGYLAVQESIVDLLEQRNEDHHKVIEIMVFEDAPASQAIAAVPGLSEANAYKIVSRFRSDLREALAARDTPDEPT